MSDDGAPEQPVCRVLISAMLQAQSAGEIQKVWKEHKLSCEYCRGEVQGKRDHRALIVNLEVSRKIAMLQLVPGEPFSVCKRWNGDRRQKAVWDIWRHVEAEKARARMEAPDIAEQLRLSVEQIGDFALDKIGREAFEFHFDVSVKETVERLNAVWLEYSGRVK